MKTEREIRVHRFASTAEAYNASQTRDEIRDGDVLVAERAYHGDDVPRTIVAILVEAWPTALDDSVATGEFHTLDGESWQTFQGGRYRESARVAWRALGADLDSTGYPTTTYYSLPLAGAGGYGPAFADLPEALAEAGRRLARYLRENEDDGRLIPLRVTVDERSKDNDGDRLSRRFNVTLTEGRLS